jgi:glycine C-acetyltransferase
VTLDGAEVLLLCSNNYLGLADHPRVRQAAADAAERFGAGAGASRLISGNMSPHRRLEERLAAFTGYEAALLFGSGYLANLGAIASLAGRGQVVFSDELNHASIIDGIRLCKAARFRYKNGDIADLEAKLKEASGARHRLIATDGVFSMDGHIAKLHDVCDLADKYNAMVMVDDSHAVGFMGKRGRGTHEHHNVMARIDILTGTLGKALGGASGGYTSGRKEIIDLLRQRSRPYLFSNSVAPPIVAASIKVLDLLAETSELRERLFSNTHMFRERMTSHGFNIVPGEHPIVPVMLGDAALAARMSDMLLKRGVYVVGFSYPVVPQGKARIRVQVSAAHTPEELEFAVEQFAATKSELGI